MSETNAYGYKEQKSKKMRDCALSQSLSEFFLGNFGQRSNLKQTAIVTRKALLKLLVAPDKEIFSVFPVNDEFLYLV